MVTSSRFCRSCGVPDLLEVLDLGQHPLANELGSEKGASVECFRLCVVLCKSCGLVQIDETVSPDRLFTEYVYHSSFADTMLNHVGALASKTIVSRCLDSQSFVIEAASNDGYLLQNYVKRGIPVLGIEPAQNIMALDETGREIPTLRRFFDENLGRELKATNRLCDVFHAHNVFAHVPNPNDFLRGISHCLKEDGIAIIEAPYIRDLIEKLEFDTIYHEHFSYFSATAVDTIAKGCGLVLSNVQRVPIHGGSLRYYLSRDGSVVDANVHELLEEETSLGLTGASYYREFAERVEDLLEDVRRVVVDLKKSANSIAVYGASAKGSTMLQALGDEVHKYVDFAVDKSPHKQGFYMPGTNIRIYEPAYLEEKNPDVTLLLSWNFADEILVQQKNYIEKGGRFLVPVPRPHYIGN